MTESKGSGRRLSIAVIIPELAKYGGAERFCIESVQRWQHLHDITLYASCFNKALLREHGITDCVTCVEISPYFEGEHSILLNGTMLPKLWEREVGKHDVYHTHLWPTHLVNRHPQVWYAHEPLRVLHDLRFEQPVDDLSSRVSRKIHFYPKRAYDSITNKHYEAYLAALNDFDKTGAPDRIVANSQYTASYLSEIYSTEVEDVVYPGVNVDDFIHTDVCEEIFVTIGQLWPHKRIRLVIEAMKLVERGQLYIVGSGPEKEKLQRDVKNLGLEDRIFFLHDLTNLEIQILISRCLAVVFTPIKEPFGIVALEAMAAGKPLIVADEGGYIEVLNDHCAFRVPPHPSAVAEKMNYLLQNPDQARIMGRAGLEEAKQYTWEASAQKTLDILEATYAQWDKTQPKKVQADVGRPFVGAQYFCWYKQGFGNVHWGDTPLGAVSDVPLAGYYESAMGTTILNHFALAEEAGIEFLLLNFHVDETGPNANELVCIENMFRLAAQNGSKLKFAIQPCFYNCSLKDAETVLKLIHKVFAYREHYLQLSGKPLLSFFWSGAYDGDYRWLKLIREETEHFTTIANSLRMYPNHEEVQKTAGVFDGFALFSPLEIGSQENWEELWSEAMSDASAGKQNLRIATVSPGYDDRHVLTENREGNAGRYISREEGATYRRTLDFALSQTECLDLVIISTFNEFHENTFIEPSVDTGNRYLEMTAEFTKKVKSKWRK